MTTSGFYFRDTCRLCESSDLERVIELTPTPPGNYVLTADEIEEKRPSYPLEVYFCNDYYASESSWNVFDSDGVGYYDGGYGVWSYDCMSEFLSLDDGAYTITVYDSYGDGGLWAGVYNPGVGTYAELSCENMGGWGNGGECGSESFLVGWEDDPGAYPFSEPFGVPVLAASSALVMGISMEDFALIYGYYLSLMGVLSIYLLSNRIHPSYSMALLVGLAYSSSQYFVDGTYWNMSNRSMMFGLIPLSFIYLLTFSFILLYQR